MNDNHEGEEVKEVAASLSSPFSTSSTSRFFFLSRSGNSARSGFFLWGVDFTSVVWYDGRMGKLK
ncbi:hypothetical protein AGMMS50268_33980 [Spirochaetia bacterium]|nr:hypothetical protein AGMMS50268_33980 [Spirochaetia bacterium]